ncbi:MAG TPA: nitrate- and nitrite sensing domain-containing protein [Polyangiaceae bacterium]|nr:nitrate- and nitrite sensing domain-containing protein [Polyangiaceae bacterium]
MLSPPTFHAKGLIDRASIRIKLLLLAGVPVLGALVLALLIVRDARSRAQSTAALGSIEDVARVSVYLGDLLHRAQSERAVSARVEGADEALTEPLIGDLRKSRAEFDAAQRALEQFLAQRDVSKLPERLARELNGARSQFRRLPDFRQRLDRERVALQEIHGFFDQPAEALVQATGALTELSDDADLLRSISALVALLELTERSSRQHALLAYVFEAKQFPPGTYKNLVTLVTEEATHAQVFVTHADKDARSRFQSLAKDPDVLASHNLRQEGLDTLDETFEVDPQRWFTTQGMRLERLGGLERSITLRIATAAKAKSGEIRGALRTSFILSGLVLVISAILAVGIYSRIRRSLDALGQAASKVRSTKDYTVRAQKTSEDEIGVLADAFNEMLSGIEQRDAELAAHRDHLEAMVAERTSQLATRNQAMRLVLDNVEQGLATIRLDGGIEPERSRAFDHWFGESAVTTRFWRHLSGQDERTAQMLELGWELVVDNTLPVDVALDQLPKRLTRDGRHYTLGFRLLGATDSPTGALLIVSDVTNEVAARAEQDRQREHVAIFEHIGKDRGGFVEFFDETNQMIGKLTSGTAHTVGAAMMLTHTIKGNAAQFGVSSVAAIAHELETSIIDRREVPTAEMVAQLNDAWATLAGRVRQLLGSARGRLELYHGDLDELAKLAARAGSSNLVLEAIERLKREPVALRFSRMSEQLASLALRFGKPTPEMVIEHSGVRLPASRFGSFWSSLIHVLRNIMDHGIELTEERIAQGKPERAVVTLRAWTTSTEINIEIVDDGRGFDWSKVAAKAKKLGLPCTTRRDLELALFRGGLSTKEQVTDVSGRGVGLSAVFDRCRALNGNITVDSTHGKGTRMTFRFPLRGNENSLAPVSEQAVSLARVS